MPYYYYYLFYFKILNVSAYRVFGEIGVSRIGYVSDTDTRIRIRAA
jgi:hypothetical protein